MYDILFLNKDPNKWKEFSSEYPNAIWVTSVNDWQQLKKIAFTKMFWVVWEDIDFLYNYNLYEYTPDFGQDEYVHIFKNRNFFDGACLFAKYHYPTNKEIEHRFFINKVEVNETISKPRPYDIVFISYQEPNAEENYKKIKTRFPNIKRIHGVKGIHQAHIKAAEICDTEMFWVVDGDAVIDDNFNFDHQVASWDKDVVHVWRSLNPINDLVYGYGGVKLLPRKLTLAMDTTKPDMTTSISSKFKAVPETSNITAFNTDPFNTWKSAFRECVKLSSKTIQGQVDEETEQRLQTWTTQGRTRRFGDSAIRGAISGCDFGFRNRNNSVELARINDFDWLEQEFARNYQ